jgi:hypothetical protein
MNSLLLNTIMNPQQDAEISTYKFLGTLKGYLQNIRNFKTYPALSELVNLTVRLENLRKSILSAKDSDDGLFILNDENSIFRTIDPDSENLVLIKWMLSQINPILEEGIVVYDFVDQNMEIKLINGDSDYKEEGFLIIPNNQTCIFNIYKFNCTLHKSENYPESNLKTEFLQSMILNNQESISIQYKSLLDIFGNNPVPVYICETSLDFPFEETIYQIARKKLLNKLSL